ncbi:M67 family metallopeptidase [Chlorogloeopsis sp. ULAP02]|uniref:M67 family metallopeptidase n=1 Tax=Chlorogloeopsis sp. ULAP02 TaxID=3107926 RepID=UPI00313652A0
MIRLREKDWQIIRSHAEKTYPEECCGIVFGERNDCGKTVVEIMPTENAWGTQAATDFPAEDIVYGKRHRYAIAPEIMLQAQKQAREHSLDIIGIYHSHNDHPAIPSEFDREYAWQEYSYIIVSVQKGKTSEMNSWYLDDNHQFQQEELKIKN